MRSFRVLLALLIAAPVLANTYTVTNTADSGAGSLRQAVLDANAQAGADLVTFSIPNGPFVIVLTSAPITVTDVVTIDGSTQDPTTSGPVIEVRSGLIVSAASNVIIKNLFFTGAATSTVSPDDCCSPVVLNMGNLTLTGCWIGGIGPGKPRNHIGVLASSGTTATFSRNVISGNDIGLELKGRATLDNNLIGVDPTGTFSVPNTRVRHLGAQRLRNDRRTRTERDFRKRSRRVCRLPSNECGHRA